MGERADGGCICCVSLNERRGEACYFFRVQKTSGVGHFNAVHVHTVEETALAGRRWVKRITDEKAVQQRCVLWVLPFPACLGDCSIPPE